MLLGKNFDSIDQTTINGLVAAGATESIHLEFKRVSYGGNDDAKKELLKDISSFANTLGGHLVIGMDDEEGVARAVTPLTGINIDKELLRLEQIVETGNEPKIIGLRMKRVQVGNGEVIVVHIPRSFNPPHRVIFKGSNRYYTRHSSGVSQPSLDELRMLFGQQRSIEERARAFVRERHLRIQANDGAYPMSVKKGTVVMHLVSLPDFGADRRLEIDEIKQQHGKFRPIGSNDLFQRINLDGLNVVHAVVHDSQECQGNTQIFRNGSVEATWNGNTAVHEDKPMLAPYALPENIKYAFRSYMGGLKALDVSPPILLQISFLDMSGVRLGGNQPRGRSPSNPYQREELNLPPSIIPEYRDDENYEPVIAEQMDFLWNAFGLEKCPYFKHQ